MIHFYILFVEAAMGAKMGSQSGKNMEYVKSVKVICELLWMRIRSPWLWPKFMWYVTGNGPKFQKAFKVVTGFTQRVRKVYFSIVYMTLL